VLAINTGHWWEFCCEILFLAALVLETVRNKLKNIQYKMEQQQDKTNRLLDELATLRNTTMDGMYLSHAQYEVLMTVLVGNYRTPEVYTSKALVCMQEFATLGNCTIKEPRSVCIALSIEQGT